MAGESADVMVKTGAINREESTESIALDRSASLGKKLDDFDLIGLQGWLKALGKNISLRFRLLRAQCRRRHFVLLRRELLREIRILRAKAELLHDPLVACPHFTMVSLDPHKDRRSANQGCEAAPVFSDPVHHGEFSFGLLGGEMLDGDPNANRDQAQNPTNRTERKEKERDKSEHQLDRKK